MNKNPTKQLARYLLLCTLLGFSSHAISAVVPPGTLLAEEQIFRFDNSADPASIDPQKVEEDAGSNIARQLFETLVLSDAKGQLIPGAAETWQHSDDYKIWTFQLRKGAKWSNGDPVLASDFVFAFRRLADPKTAATYASYLEYLKLNNATEVIGDKRPLDDLGIKALDDYTLELTLSESVPYLDKLLEYPALAPVNQKVVEKHGDAWIKVENFVGNGAFKLTNWVINEKLEMEANPHYWDHQNTVLKKIIMYPITSDNISYTRYRANELDISRFPSELRDKVKKEYGTEVNIAPILSTYFYELNHNVEPTKNKLVRQALSLALERHIITDKVLGNGQVPAYSFTPPYIGAGNKVQAPEWSTWSQKARNQKAIELLQQAGYSQQNPLRFTLLYNTSEGHKSIAIAASSIWKKNTNKLVEVKLENQEWKTFLDTKNQGNYTVARSGWNADYNDASTFLNNYLSTSSNNASGYKNSAYDQQLAQAFAAKNEEERAEVYAKAQAILDEDFVMLPIYYYTSVNLIKPHVQGFAFGHPQKAYYFKDVYITK